MHGSQRKWEWKTSFNATENYTIYNNTQFYFAWFVVLHLQRFEIHVCIMFLKKTSYNFFIL